MVHYVVHLLVSGQAWRPAGRLVCFYFFFYLIRN